MMKITLANLLLIACLCVFSTTAHASDFSIIFYFFRGLYIFLAIILLFITWVIAKNFKNKWGLGLLWGLILALIATPIKTAGGNGTANAAVLENILVSLMGGDSIYGIEAGKLLLIAVPIWVAICIVFFFLKERQDKQGNS